MPEITSPRPSDRVETDPVTARVRDTRTGLAALIQEADEARQQREETTAGEGSAVCAWNHFENIPTFYNWNNRPR
ncbi:multiple cyclophane-containing RiPP AmcA [Actinoplanes sp. NPDC051475]|uniref:multiple cyclophane-containing RiPP AmcA n=1 Tax=Actinoplanes sp. NPDC051475 TaxID=3157225 RepID=UPI00344D1201